MAFKLFGAAERKKATLNSVAIKEMTDSQLVESVLGGENDAFTELVKRYEKLVYSTAYFSVKNSDDAWDISQDVFLRVYNSIGSFRGESALSTWLFRLTKNVTYDYMRKHYKHKDISLTALSGSEDDRAYEIPDSDISSNPEESYERKETVETVRNAIKKLSEEHRSIIVLREIEGYSYSQIADMLGVEEGTVKSRLSRARAALKKILGEKV